MGGARRQGCSRPAGTGVTGRMPVPLSARALRSGAGWGWEFGCCGEMRGGFCISVVLGVGRGVTEWT